MKGQQKNDRSVTSHTKSKFGSRAEKIKGKEDEDDEEEEDEEEEEEESCLKSKLKATIRRKTESALYTGFVQT